VVAYDFNDEVLYQSDFMRSSFGEHAGNYFDLYEGNIGTEQYNDADHATASMITRFRNFFTGWESCASGQCGAAPFKDSSTNSLNDEAYDRYENNVGNVLGTPGYHTSYETSSTPSANKAIYVVGSGNGNLSPPIPTDPLTTTTSMFWANYDVVTAAVRFCGSSSDTRWTTTCASTSEIPTGISPYPNALPTLGDTGAGQAALPPSFYLSAKPAWFGSLPFPPIGPDVSGGNVGVCSGILNTLGQFAGVPAISNAQCIGASLVTGWAGHVNTNPAMNCALNVMKMPPDGSGGVLAFDANTCYAAGPPAATPTTLVAIPH
jgi:hypothetical protein